MADEDTKIRKIMIEGSKNDQPVKLTVNGVATTIPVGVETHVHEDFLGALGDSDFNFSFVDGDVGGAAGASADAETIAPRSGPDDLHGKGAVEKDEDPSLYAPEPGAAEAPSPTEGVDSLANADPNRELGGGAPEPAVRVAVVETDVPAPAEVQDAPASATDAKAAAKPATKKPAAKKAAATK